MQQSLCTCRYIYTVATKSLVLAEQYVVSHNINCKTSYLNKVRCGLHSLTSDALTARSATGDPRAPVLPGHGPLHLLSKGQLSWQVNQPCACGCM